MKVWVVMEAPHYDDWGPQREDRWIAGVFLSKEKADKFVMETPFRSMFNRTGKASWDECHEVLDAEDKK